LIFEESSVYILEPGCVGVCVSLFGDRLRNHWHYWRLTDLLFWTGWHSATQICDLEGHDVPNFRVRVSAA